MSNIVNNLVEDYIRTTLKEKDGLLRELEEYANTVKLAADPSTNPEALLLTLIGKVTTDDDGGDEILTV